jgi:Ni/Fe-hydrogenase subunit HybB-like protein
MSVYVSHILCALACALALVFVVVEIKNKRLKEFKAICIGILVMLSAVTTIFFAAGSYLFYIPLLVTIIAGFLRERKIVYTAFGMLSGITVLLLWVPVVFLLRVAFGLIEVPTY